MSISLTKTPQVTQSEIFLKLRLNHDNSGTCGAKWHNNKSQKLLAMNPTSATLLANVECTSNNQYDEVIADAESAQLTWRETPAPVRGEIVRQIGNAFRENKEALGALISLEMGKIPSEGLGEVQEAIDICDFAVGLSRQLCGKTMHSERVGHRMYKQWHPLGVVRVITALNFPCAVWAWNAALALVCGNAVVWKPSEKTPLVAIAMQHIVHKVLEQHNLQGLSGLITSPDKNLGEKMVDDERIALISATGSVPMGREVGQNAAKRFAKSILELGGNNALIVMEDADLNLAIPAITFGSVGTAGQRCTSTRRLLVHESIIDDWPWVGFYAVFFD